MVLSMVNYQFTDKMLKNLNLIEWQQENQRVNNELGIQRKLVSRQVTLEIIEALVHDALAYRKVIL